MTNTEIVLAFVDAWNRMDWDAVIDAFHDDVVYHNLPMDKLDGKPAVREFIDGLQPDGVDWEVLAIAETGNKVLTERVDRFDMPGDHKIDLPVMGIFEIEGGRIIAWRDYFDLDTFRRQLS